MDMTNYNPITALRQLKTQLYCINSAYTCKHKVPARLLKMKQDNLKLNKRMARILVKDLQEYRRQYPELYEQYRKEVV